MTMMQWRDNAVTMMRWHYEAIAQWRDSDDAMLCRAIVNSILRCRHRIITPSLYLLSIKKIYSQQPLYNMTFDDEKMLDLF